MMQVNLNSNDRKECTVNMKNPKPNRKRNKRLQFWVSNDEITAIRERAQSIGIVNLGAYLRKMAIDGMIVRATRSCWA